MRPVETRELTARPDGRAPSPLAVPREHGPARTSDILPKTTDTKPKTP